MKKQSQQCWTGLDLKICTFLILGPSQKLRVLCSMFKKKPKSLNLVFNSSPSQGDQVLAQGPKTPCVPMLVLPGTPESPDEPFRPLTQCLDPRAKNRSIQNTPKLKKPEIVPFSLNLSTISQGSPANSHSTPDRVRRSNRSKTVSPSNISRRNSPIIKARKRFITSPTPRKIRERNSRILDGLEPSSKKQKLDKNPRKKAKGRRSLQSWFLANLFKQ